MAKKNKEFNQAVFLFVSFLMISNIPKHIWTNIFFSSLVFIEITLIFVLSYFWIKNYLIKTKEICSDIKTIDKFNGAEFENYIKELYIKLGYNAKTTNASHDFGADIVVVKGYDKICIQAKRYNENRTVGISAVQEVIGSLNYYKANKGIVISTSNFTKSAIQLAKINNIILINRSELQKMILKISTTSGHPALIKFINFITEP